VSVREREGKRVCVCAYVCVDITRERVCIRMCACIFARGRRVTMRACAAVETLQSRHCKMIRLFCKRALETRLYSANETYVFKEPP